MTMRSAICCACASSLATRTCLLHSEGRCLMADCVLLVLSCALRSHSKPVLQKRASCLDAVNQLSHHHAVQFHDAGTSARRPGGGMETAVIGTVAVSCRGATWKPWWRRANCTVTG